MCVLGYANNRRSKSSFRKLWMSEYVTRLPVPPTCSVLTALAFPYGLHFAGMGKPSSDIRIRFM